MSVKRLLLVPTVILILASIGAGAQFGTVVPIGGHVSDLAFDPGRGVLYIANFGAKRIDVMSASDNSLREPILVPPAPSSLALSGSGRYLAVGHLEDPGTEVIK